MAKWAKAPFLAQYAYEADAQGRKYRDPFSGAVVPSVTTVLKNTPKADLMGWAAMKVAERARDRPDIVMGDPDKVVDRLRYAHTDYRNERGEVGTGVHQTIQAEFEGTWDFPDLDEEQVAMLDQWAAFVELYDAKVLLSEFTVFGDGYAGTADAIMEWADPLTGERHISLVDFKTAAGLHDEHRYQLAALAKARFWARRVDGGEAGAVRLPPKKDLPESFWVKSETPAFDSVYLLQLRADFFEFEEVRQEELPILGDVFDNYVSLWNNLERLKEMRKGD